MRFAQTLTAVIVAFSVCQITSGVSIKYPLPGESRPVCVMMDTTNFTFNITYQSEHRQLSQMIPLSDVRYLAVNGDCGDGPPYIPSVELDDDQPDAVIKSVKFTFTHIGQPATNVRGLARMSIDVHFDSTKLDNSTETNTDVTATLKHIPLNNVNYSYYCNETQRFQLSNGVDAMVDVMQVQGFHMKLDAFSSSNGSVCPLHTLSTTAKPHTTTTDRLTTPTKADTTTHDITTPTKTDTTTNDVTTPTKTDTTTHDVTTPTKTDTTTHDVTTPTKADTTTHDVTTPTKTDTTTNDVTTPNKTETTTHDITTTSHHMTTTTTKTTTTNHMLTTSTPAPPMVTNTFSVYEDGKTCLLLKAAMELHISYNRSDEIMMYTAAVPAEVNVTYSGMCNNDTEMISMDWMDKMAELSMTLEFSKTNKGDSLSASKEDKYTMSAVYVNYTLFVHQQPEIIFGNISAEGLDEFSTAIGDYYMCSDGAKVDLGEGNSLQMSDVQIQGFRDKNDNSTFFGSENNCKNPSPTVADTVVPVVVGAVLGALVVVVLIGYCIGRRRASPTDYETL